MVALCVQHTISLQQLTLSTPLPPQTTDVFPDYFRYLFYLGALLLPPVFFPFRVCKFLEYVNVVFTNLGSFSVIISSNSPPYLPPLGTPAVLTVGQLRVPTVHWCPAHLCAPPLWASLCTVSTAVPSCSLPPSTCHPHFKVWIWVFMYSPGST